METLGSVLVICSTCRDSCACMQVVRNAVGIAIVDDYHELGKYNVKEVCKEKEAEDSKDKDEKKDDAERK